MIITTKSKHVAATRMAAKERAELEQAAIAVLNKLPKAEAERLLARYSANNRGSTC